MRKKALGGGPAKMMVARGLIPIANPRDLLSVFYQLSLDGDVAIRQAAAQSADSIPDPVLEGALADSELDARVLDYFAQRLVGKSSLQQCIILNPACADETIVTLVASASSTLVDLIAQNEERLLRCPEIVGAMYRNSKARMSTVDRAVELAVRHDLVVPGIPAWDEVRKAVLGLTSEEKEAAKESDEAFIQAAESLSDSSQEADSADADAQEAAAEIPISRMTIPMKIRLATLGNAFARAVLVRDPIKLVSVAAVKSPGVSDMEASKYASNSALCDEVVTYIANRRDWTRLYSVKLSLVQNPKTPVPSASRFLGHLRDRDLRQVSRSKGVPSAIVAQAKKLIRQRQGGEKKKK